MSVRDAHRARTDAEIAEVIRTLLTGRPQKEIAALLDVDQSAVSRALAGKRAFNLQEVAQIAEWTGKPADEILFAQPGGVAFRCEGADAACDVAAQQCRDIVRDLLAFRAVAE